jgi:hypothetical protein
MFNLSLFLLQTLPQYNFFFKKQKKTNFHVSSQGVVLALAKGLSPAVALILRKKKIKKKKITDHFIRKQLCRFLTQLWGSPVALFLVRNLQLRLSVIELVHLHTQNHRVFSYMPAPVFNLRQLQNYA